MVDTDNENEDVETDDLEDESDGDSQDNEDFDPKRAAAKINKVNREAANLRKRLKAYEDEEAKRKEADLSEVEKAVARAEAAEKRAADLEFNSLRSEVALSKGLTAAQAKRLQGTTKEELEEDATELLAMFGGSDKPNPQRKPTKLRGGADGTDDPPEKFDAKSLAEKLRNRR
ncbi:hypothetical protein ACFQS3_02615 [Glycomyces mayteni]|uniref:Scaffolding protein n=1 Tax=Glycomyces mayteni TaxID=543887 RepID=A0ABW2D1B9_9ACTN|nr:hypothetical protein GCM10025732_48240 [Glycomyces mayteni]